MTEETQTVVPPSPVDSKPTVGTIYTCPMHPEVRQDHPGNCPKCGMTLEPELPKLEDDENRRCCTEARSGLLGLRP